MASFDYDLVVLGSGPGGYVAAIRASQLGLKTALIERENLGGICLNWGCIPTKALIKSAEVNDYLHHAGDYGLTAKEISHDFTKVVERSRGVADGMSKGVQFLMKKNNIDVIMGEGSLVDANTIEVKGNDTKKVTGKHLMLAVGARARSLPGIEIDNQKIIGYRKAMTLEQQPKKLVVMGSGAIGTEFAYFYNSMGTEVTLVEYADSIIPFADAKVSRTLQQLYKKRGMTIMTGSKVTHVDTSGTGVKVTVETKKGTEVIEADVLLSAVGIQANVEGINLDKVGVKLDKNLIQVNEWYQTSVPSIYAIGDCVPGPALAHKASAEAILCVEKLAGHDVQPLDYGNIPSCVYCVPEVAMVGLTEKQAKDEGYDILVGEFPFQASGRAKAMGKADGFVKLIFDKKYGEFLGAHMIGAGVTEMIAEVVTARKLETTGHEIIKSVHPHPTMSEAVMEAAAAAYGEVIHL